MPLETEAKRIQSRLSRQQIKVPIQKIRDYLIEQEFEGILSDEEIKVTLEHFAKDDNRGSGRRSEMVVSNQGNQGLVANEACGILTNKAKEMGVEISVADIESMSLRLLETINQDSLNVLSTYEIAMALITEYMKRQEDMMIAKVSQGFDELRANIATSNTRLTSQILDEFDQTIKNASNTATNRGDNFRLSIENLLAKLN